MSDSDVTTYDADYSGLPNCDGGGNGPMTASATVTIFSVWDGDWAILEEYTTGYASDKGLVEQYVQGYHGLVTKTDTDPLTNEPIQTIYYYQDELGSTSHVAGADGALLEYYKYDLYGKPTYWSGSSPSSQLPAPSFRLFRSRPIHRPALGERDRSLRRSQPLHVA
jgi:hypothetical protein